jgi:hypothetical protein
MQVQMFWEENSIHRYPFYSKEILRLLTEIAYKFTKLNGTIHLLSFHMSPPVFIHVENLARDIRSLIDPKTYPFVQTVQRVSTIYQGN